MPAKPRKLNASESIESQVPDFNQDSMRSLTEKIEIKLKSQGKGAILKDASAKPKTNTPSVKGRSGENAAKGPESTFAGKVARNNATPMRKQKPAAAPRTTLGMKRFRDGRIKEERYTGTGDDVNTIKLGSRRLTMGSVKNTDFDEEMKALGGEKEDVDLIADIISESEMEGEAAEPSKMGDGFEKEMLQLVRQLGVDRVGKSELMADSESEQANRMEDLEENGIHETTPSNQVTTGVRLALKTATSAGKGQRSLVSNQQCPVFSPCDIDADSGLRTDF